MNNQPEVPKSHEGKTDLLDISKKLLQKSVTQLQEVSPIISIGSKSSIAGAFLGFGFGDILSKAFIHTLINKPFNNGDLVSLVADAALIGFGGSLLGLAMQESSKHEGFLTKYFQPAISDFQDLKVQITNKLKIGR